MEALLRVSKAQFSPELARSSCSTTSPGFDKLVDSICTLINSKDQWSSSLENSIASAAPNFHPRLLFRVLKLQRHAHMASELFQWASRRPNFTHTPFTYCALIEVLARCKDFNQIWSLIHAMHASNMSLSPVPFTTLINAYGNAGLVDDAQRAFDAMSSFGCLCYAGEVEKALEFMKEMLGMGCTPNTWTFTAIIQGFLKAERETEALSTLETMLDKGCLPDTVTYNSLLQWFCLKGNSNKALEIFEQMTMKGCMPDALTYGILVNGLFREGKADIAVHYIRRMIEGGCNPDASTYNALTAWLCTNTTPHDAVNFLSCILSIACENCGFSCLILIEGLLKAKRVDLVFATVKGLLARGICPDKTICTPVINWLCKQGCTSEVLELLEKVTELQGLQSAAGG